MGTAAVAPNNRVIWWPRQNKVEYFEEAAQELQIHAPCRKANGDGREIATNASDEYSPRCVGSPFSQKSSQLVHAAADRGVI